MASTPKTELNIVMVSAPFDFINDIMAQINL